MPSLYETDTYAWALDQARRLRTGQALDIENLAEEIEDLGKQERRTLVNTMAVLISHMLKWDCQPAQRTKSWEYTIREHQNRTAGILEESPSLRSHLAELIPKAYASARLQAAAETGLDLEDFPVECPYSWEQILGE